MNSSFNLDCLPFLEHLLPFHAKAGQQPDNLCGPYWVALLLNAYSGRAVSAVDVAIAASTVVPSTGNPADWLPAGASSRPGASYETIPTDPDVAKSGTSITGLMRAAEVLSQGKFCLLPLRSQDWELGLKAIWDLCQAHSEIVPLLNIHTRYCWGSRLTPLQAIAYLAGQSIIPPAPDWSVGHFALLAGRLQGRANTLYALLDTYPHFGWEGMHLQPPTAVALALSRPDLATAGGVAVFMQAKARSRLESLLIQSGLQIALWDNGSPST